MMISVSKVLGNIYNDREVNSKYNSMKINGKLDSVTISRYESEKVRIRKSTKNGADLAMTFPQGTRLRHGDVLFLDDYKMIIVEIAPELVILVKMKRENITSDKVVRTAIIIGHTIGNLHRPIKIVDGDKACFPIQAESELETFRSLFHSIEDLVDLEITKMVFEPEEELHSHEH